VARGRPPWSRLAALDTLLIGYAQFYRFLFREDRWRRTKGEGVGIAITIPCCARVPTSESWSAAIRSATPPSPSDCAIWSARTGQCRMPGSGDRVRLMKRQAKPAGQEQPRSLRASYPPRRNRRGSGALSPGARTARPLQPGARTAQVSVAGAHGGGDAAGLTAGIPGRGAGVPQGALEISSSRAAQVLLPLRGAAGARRRTRSRIKTGEPAA
jgi:hypothetical protein